MKGDKGDKERQGLVPGGHDHAHVLGDPPGRSAHLSSAKTSSECFLERQRNAAGRFRPVSEDLHSEHWQGVVIPVHHTLLAQ